MTGRVTFGKTSWDTPAPTTGGGGDDFLHLNKDGQYILRVIGEAPFEYAAHWAEDVNGQKRRVKCAGRDCVLCKEGVRPQVRYLLEVINFKNNNDTSTGETKIVEFGAQVYNQIRSLYNNPHWGDPRGYNIMIDRDQKRGPSGMYQVMPLGKEELNTELKAASVEFKDRIKEVLGKFAEPSTNEEILMKLGRVQNDENSSWSSDTEENAPAEGVADDDEDFDF